MYNLFGILFQIVFLIMFTTLQNEHFDDDEDDYNIADDHDGMHFLFHLLTIYYK